MKTVLVSAVGKTHRPRAQASGYSVHHEIDLANQHHEHLLVDVLMRRMWRAAWGKLRLVYLDWKSVVEIPVKHRARLIYAAGPTGLHREFVELIRFRGKVTGLRLRAGGRQGWKKES